MTKSILITGSSTGFGYEAAIHLAKKGHRVLATMRAPEGRNAEKATALRTLAQSEGLKLDVRELDVTSDESVERAVAEIDPIDVVINNAGLGYLGPVEGFTAQEFAAQLDVNVLGPFRVTKAVLAGMRARRDGLIIQVSSISGRTALPGFGLYHASKWALEGLSESWRYELAHLGIDVVLVEPGPFLTNFAGNITPSKNQDLSPVYEHVSQFNESFVEQLHAVFEDPVTPTDPQIVVDIFDQLINTPKGQRPLRTVAGLDFGCQAINDATEPLRQEGLRSSNLAHWDGPKGAD